MEIIRAKSKQNYHQRCLAWRRSLVAHAAAPTIHIIAQGGAHHTTSLRRFSVQAYAANLRLPPQNAFERKKCLVLDDRTSLRDWYADNPSEYGKLWDPLLTDGIKVEILVPQMIALPLWAAKLYQDF